ncbi:FAD-dependent oxidoreductase [Lentzea sp. NBRC 105346]|uniref:NAD(P)/FAD-dependent oxidoreductase n=1 Tax=Lentzea sp. NBRC 105346 TaxID=3032205 RepID=UPI0024A30403|nr:FAD-binding oxidoreductase [Lentzea sp. NBRC 105346]GLZ29545.1 FAD-dependent oxidoreductase [Lentzea sp. NBRC 105346]
MISDSAEVVIVGGGVMGTSIAFHLAEAGVRDVVLVERDELGSGSTCKAAGGVRAQFSDELNIQLGARSLEAFKRFSERPGQEIDLHQVGYLFLLSDPAHVEAFERNVALQNSLGVPSRMISVAEARAMSPLISTEGLLAAAYSPDDGHCTPESVVLGYATAARRLGARLHTHTAVTDILMSGNDITGVVTDRGTIRTNAVICTAGVWAPSIGEMVGVDLPVVPLRRQVMFTEPMPSLDPVVPFTIDFASTFYFHREGRGLLFGMSDPEETPGFKLDVSDAWMPRLTAAIEKRAPSLLDVGVRTGWAGLYEVSPDHNAIIGESRGVSRFLYATGFSGHGFLQGPAVGEIIRDLYLERAPMFDVSSLDVTRFAADETRPELNVV